MDPSGRPWGDPASIAVAAIVVCWLAAVVRAWVVDALGDDTPRRAGLLRRPHRLVDRTGSVLVPAFTALGLGVGLGWPARVPMRPDELSRPSRALLALTPSLTASVVAVAAWSLRSGGAAVGPAVTATGGSSDAVLLAIALEAVTLAVLWLLPLPALPGGDLVALVLRGRASARWARWHRGSGLLAVAVVTAVLVATDLPHRLGPIA